MVEAPRCPGQVGYPPSVAADAQLGFSVMAYQLAELPSGRCDGGGHIWARLIGTCTRAHKASRNGDIAQLAKVGFCPCCAGPTHIAAPSRYSVGEYPPNKARVVHLWKEHGPWAVRYFAGDLYAHDSGYLPPAWDWAAQSLAVRAPPLFDGYFGTVRDNNPAVSPPLSQEAMSRGPKP